MSPFKHAHAAGNELQIVAVNQRLQIRDGAGVAEAPEGAHRVIEVEQGERTTSKLGKRAMGATRERQGRRDGRGLRPGKMSRGGEREQRERRGRRESRGSREREKTGGRVWREMSNKGVANERKRGFTRANKQSR